MSARCIRRVSAQRWFGDFSCTKSCNPRFLLTILFAGFLTACGGGGGGGSRTATPDTTPPVSPSPSLTFTSSASSISPGGSVTLSWQSTNADSCEASGGWSGSRGTSGQQTINSLQQSQTYSLSCSGAGGAALRQVQVSVVDAAEISLSLSSDVDAVLINETVQLTWTSNNAETCEASGDWSGQVDTSGTFTSAPLTDNALFQLTCFAQGQSAVSQLGIAVTDNTVRWAAPTENVDGTPLTDLDGFAVYWGDRSRDYDSSVNLGAGARQWTLDVAPGTYYLAVTAINSQNEESGYSNEIVKVIP
ncbi:MAG: hypothetical protein ACFHXK_19570 [bacterium]